MVLLEHPGERGSHVHTPPGGREGRRREGRERERERTGWGGGGAGGRKLKLPLRQGMGL